MCTILWYVLAASVVWPVLVWIFSLIIGPWERRADARKWAATRARVQAKSEEMLRRGQL